MKCFSRIACLCLFLLIVSLSPPGSCRADSSFELGIRGGLSRASLTGDATEKQTIVAQFEDGSILNMDSDLKSGRNGLKIGAYGHLRFTERFGLRLEANYVQKGGKGDISGDIDMAARGDRQTIFFTGSQSFNLSYFEFPLLGVVSFPAGQDGRLEIYGGPFFAINTKAEFEMEMNLMGQTDSSTEDMDEFLTDNELGTAIGAGYQYLMRNSRLFLDLRYSFGFDSIDDTGEDVDLKNRGLEMTVGLAFPLEKRY